MRKAIRAALVCALLAGAAAPAGAVDLLGPFGRAMERGIEAHDAGDYAGAAAAFSDALLERPGSYEALMNRGLALGRAGDARRARIDFQAAVGASGDDLGRRAAALYNLGRLEFDTALAQAQAAFEDQENPDSELIEQALANAIASFRSQSEALSLAPGFEDARANRAQAQHLIELLARREPPPEDMTPDQSDGDDDPTPSDGDDEQQQQPGGEGDDDADPQQEPGDGDEQDPSDGDGDGDQQQDPQQPSDPGDQQDDGPPEGQQQPQQPDRGDDQDGDGDDMPDPADAAGDPTDRDGQQDGEAAEIPDFDPGEMTPEEAKRLLNLLGNRDILVRRLPEQPREDRRTRKNW